MDVEAVDVMEIEGVAEDVVGVDVELATNTVTDSVKLGIDRQLQALDNCEAANVEGNHDPGVRVVVGVTVVALLC